MASAFGRLPRKQLDWRSACLFMVADPQWKRKIWITGWVLMLPVIGWPMLLGYRKEAVIRLTRGRSPLLPEWNRREAWIYLREGAKAMLVIHTWFVPLYGWVGWRLLQSPQAAEIPWTIIAGIAVVIPILSTLVIPALVWLGQYGVAAPVFALPEALLISGLFGLATFLIPAGFLNVSRTNQFRNAFKIHWSWPFLWRNFPAYVEAWIGSGLISLVGHFAIPFSPWGIGWAYLGIVFFFNEVPLAKPAANDLAYMDARWFNELRDRYWIQFEVSGQGMLQTSKPVADPADPGELPRQSFRLLRLGWVQVPVA